ncbi:hypothetical protein ACJIZ3_009098 [Penstemon smallii]|uniref:Glycosyltransferase n=1 Tax=Penstemon smallii TaxID=265156 RepID=A0ABD3TBJ8_9LAMI
MCSIDELGNKPHAVCIPFPAQGHVNPMLKLAKLLHEKGYYITFVNTECNHRRLLESTALNDFRFATIPDGFDAAAADDDISSLCLSITNTCLEPFCDLITKLNSSAPDVPQVSCVVSDGVMSFTAKAAERFGLPEVLFWTISACGLLGYTQYEHLIEKGYVPLKDMRQVTNGYMEIVIDWIPGMKNIRLRDLPAFIRTTDPDDIMLNFVIQEINSIPKATALVINTFDALEHDVLQALSAMFTTPIYTIGPLQLMMNEHVHDQRVHDISSSLWEEDQDCIKWLDTKEPESVVYVNFGSITVMNAQQLTEFAWGLANSNKTFLWVIRPDMVVVTDVDDSSVMLPQDFVTETKDRSMLISWCPQEQVLKHSSIGGFLTHSGWNSTIESIAGGVPVICWPFFSEQQTNCRYSCVEWEMGMEIDNNVKREEVEALVKELMDGEKGKKMKLKAMNWKMKAEEATAPGGSSLLNLDKLINEVLMQ